MDTMSLNRSYDRNSFRETRIAMNKKRREAIFRRQVAILVLIISLLIFAGVFMFSAVMSDAQSDSYVPVFKYYTTVTVHTDDTLRGIADEYYYPSKYRDIKEYISEICSINNIGDADMIKSGEALIIPYYSTEFK